jgi:hypothetical protein
MAVGIVAGISYAVVGAGSAFRVVIDPKTHAEPAYKRRVSNARLTRSTRSGGLLFLIKLAIFNCFLLD